MWALSYYLTQLSLGCQSSCQQTPRGLETRCGREGHTRPRGHSENPRCSCQQTPTQLETRCGSESHTRPRGPSESPDGVDPNIRRTRHNVTVITVGSKYEVYVRSPAPSHMQTFNNPFEPCNKLRGKIC